MIIYPAGSINGNSVIFGIIYIWWSDNEYTDQVAADAMHM